MAPSLEPGGGGDGHQNRVVRFELPDIGQLTTKALQLERPDTLAAGELLCHRHRFVHRRLVAQGDQGLDLSGALPDLRNSGAVCLTSSRSVRVGESVSTGSGTGIRHDWPE